MSEVKRFTLAEVSCCDGSKGQPLWIVYKDGIYDLTNYINEHPGGYETLMEEAGKDATKTFDDIGHSGDARAVMQKYKVGELIEIEKRYDANGKKLKRVASSPQEKTNTARSFLNIITCGLCG